MHKFRPFALAYPAAVAIAGALLLIGCRTDLSGDYFDPALAKHPFRLHLDGDGRYTFEQMFMPGSSSEGGRWRPVEGHVVMLVPDDASKPPWFARLRTENPLEGMRRSQDVREVLK